MCSVHTIPLLFLNLGGEMLYILDQRLTAQKISKDKAIKVMNDIVGIMFNERFLKELFKPQEVTNKHALRKLFEDLAHGSIMRLNKASMDKLYDLMTMTFKYQLFMASQPLDVLFITLNHLDSVRSFVPAPYLQKQIDLAYEMLLEKYAHMSFGELQNIRYCLLNFLQDLKVRVSVFLKQGVQKDDGKFVIPVTGTVPAGWDVPGCIKIFGWDGQLIQERQFEAGGRFTISKVRGTLEKHGDRGTTLGSNIYREYPSSEHPSPTHAEESAMHPANETKGTGISDSLAIGREELNMLMAQILGQRGSIPQGSLGRTQFQLDFFSEEIEEEELAQPVEVKETINIDVHSHPQTSLLDEIYGELTIEDTSNEDCTRDIADMLDDLI